MDGTPYLLPPACRLVLGHVMWLALVGVEGVALAGLLLGVLAFARQLALRTPDEPMKPWGSL